MGLSAALVLLADLYKATGAYRYNGGWNIAAVIATVLGCGAAWIGLGVDSLKVLYDYAWFVGFGVAFFSYLGLMKAKG